MSDTDLDMNDLDQNDIGRIMRASCAISPQSNAIELDGQWYDWAFVAETVEKIEGILDAHGVPKDAEVALLCRNKPHQVAAFCAVICSGRCVTPINPFSAQNKVVADLQDLDAAVVIASEADWQSTALQSYVDENNALAISLDGSRSQDHILERNPEREITASRFSCLRPGVAVLIQSSGTTGKPKRIPIGASNLSAAYNNIPAGVISTGKSKVKTKPALITQPLVHIGGLFWVVNSLLEARPISLLEKFDVQKWATAVEQYQIRVCSLVPAMINMVLESDLASEKLTSLICIRSGTAPLPAETQATFEQRFSVPILPTYGATEFSGAVCGWTMPLKKQFGDSKVGSVGKAYDGVDLRIVDRSSGEPLPIGETGILQVRSSQMMEGDSWVATTDLADIDADDFIWLRGRADSAINRGGFKIIPTEVAGILEKNELVKEAVVVGIDDARLGQVPVAAVELIDNTAAISEESLRAWAKENMTSYFVPVRIAVVDQLPRTPSMKVSQAEVKRLFES